MRKEGISEQIVHKKQGKIVSPLVDKLGDLLSITSWSVDRLPEYLWLALILEHEGRDEGILRCRSIIKRIMNCNERCESVQMSQIFSLDDALQRKVYSIIKSEVPIAALTPLTAVANMEYCPVFYEQFCCASIGLNERIDILNTVLRKYNEPNGDSAIDLKYLELLPLAWSGHYQFQENSPFADALLHYWETPASEGIMSIYRSSIYSLEGCIAISDGRQSGWTKQFWNVLSRITDCRLSRISYGKEAVKVDYTTFISKTKEALNYLNIQHKTDTLGDDYSVLVGSLAHSLKIFDEVIEHNLENTLIGRQVVRTLVEIYIMMKYLILKEKEKPDVWKQYKVYGIGKYKLILMKLRDGIGSEITHVSKNMLELLVNEPQTEELTDVDLKYFDDENIKAKAILVGEKDLYDIAYDYDSNFTHALWGAVRESSMLLCDNILHHFSPVPDAELSQNLPDISKDCFIVIIKLLLMTNERYGFPEWYVTYLRRCHVQV